MVGCAMSSTPLTREQWLEILRKLWEKSLLEAFYEKEYPNDGLPLISKKEKNDV